MFFHNTGPLNEVNEHSSEKAKIISQKIDSLQLGVQLGQWSQTHLKSSIGMAKSGKNLYFGMA